MNVSLILSSVYFYTYNLLDKIDEFLYDDLSNQVQHSHKHSLNNS